MESFDVVIIGAGPAGLSCAKNLTQRKSEGAKRLPSMRVLVLEKNPEIGPKVCAGGLTGEGLEYLKIPGRLLDYRFRKILVRTSQGKNEINLDSSFSLFTIDRKNLGQWQLKNLGENVTVRTGARVTEIGKDCVTVNGSEKIRYKSLVGADGSSSFVRRHLALQSKGLGIAIQYIIPEVRKDVEIFFNARLFGTGYAWIFPHRGYVSVGAGCDPKMLPPEKLRKNFHIWLKQNGIDYSGGRFESHPISFDFQGYRFKNIFLAGDAAGLASGLTGEGIYHALVSGEEVAKVILDPKYKPKKLEKLIAEKKEESAIMKKLNAVLKKRGPLPEIEQELLRLFESG
jgi:flavin-dependent dehydrogenase